MSFEFKTDSKFTIHSTHYLKAKAASLRHLCVAMHARTQRCLIPASELKEVETSDSEPEYGFPLHPSFYFCDSLIRYGEA